MSHCLIILIIIFETATNKVKCNKYVEIGIFNRKHNFFIPHYHSEYNLLFGTKILWETNTIINFTEDTIQIKQIKFIIQNLNKQIKKFTYRYAMNTYNQTYKINYTIC